MEKLTRQEALEILGNGHRIITPEYAKEVCEVVGVPFDEKLVHNYSSDPDGTFKGLKMNPGQENTDGVYTLDLSAYVANHFGVADKAGSFYGRGSQARAYAEQVAKVLGEEIR